jgi:hypothetical protein
MRGLAPRLVTGLFLAMAIVAAGCGNNKDTLTTPKGKIVKGGQALVAKGRLPPGSIPWRVEFISMDGKTSYQAVVEEDGSFSVPGIGKGIAPGKYKVAVYFFDPGPPNDILKGTFGSDRTKIVVTVEARKDVGTIDLDNPPKE